MGSTPSAIEVSLVICTRNRAPQLMQTLASVSAIASRVAWEIVVVDNGSTDNTPVLVASFAEQVNVATNLITEGRVGLSPARNAGWRAAKGRVIAFTDDDCYPRTDYIDQVFTCFQDPQISYLGGRVILHDPEDYPITIQTLEHRVELPPLSFITPGLIHGANFAFLRTALLSLGNFDCRLGAGSWVHSGEDIEMLSRASAAGYRGAYDPRPVVAHHHRRKPGPQLAKLKASYDLGRGAYFARAAMNPNIRATYLQRWYWRTLEHLRNGEFRVVLREIAGALLYVAGSIWNR